VSDRRLGSAAMLTAALLGLTGIAGWVLVHRRAGAVERPRYVFVNETDDHVHDLAFKMSLKFAEKRSSIENALIVLKRLPPGRTIEQVAVDLFGRWQIGRDRAGRGILYLYSEQENRLKIEVSYGLESLFPDADGLNSSLVTDAAIDELLFHSAQLGKFRENCSATQSGQQVGGVSDGGIRRDAGEAVGSSALQADT